MKICVIWNPPTWHVKIETPYDIAIKIIAVNCKTIFSATELKQSSCEKRSVVCYRLKSVLLNNQTLFIGFVIVVMY